jgi:hypothetical protein
LSGGTEKYHEKLSQSSRSPVCDLNLGRAVRWFSNKDRAQYSVLLNSSYDDDDDDYLAIMKFKISGSHGGEYENYIHLGYSVV